VYVRLDLAPEIFHVKDKDNMGSSTIHVEDEARLMLGRRISYAACCLAAMIVLVTCTTSEVRAWSNGGYSSDPAHPDYGTHDWIADKALAIQTRDVIFLSTTYHARYMLGTEAPDNPVYIGDSMSHHVYYYSNGVLQDDHSAVRASQLYQIALGYIRDGNYEAAAYDIGAMTHYISDIGVFGHTMGSATDWGEELHHSDYENEIESMIGSLEPPSGLALSDRSAYDSTISLASDITFGRGEIMTNVWMDANYDWTDTDFVASAMASLNSSVCAVAAVINHLMIETTPSTPAPPQQVPPSSSTTPLQAPEPPASLTAYLEGSAIVLTWSYPPDDGGSPVTGYSIYRGITQDNPSLLTSVPAGTQSWSDGSTERGETYYYWIAAENSVGTGEMSQATHVTAPGDSGAWEVPITISAIILAALASGGALMWRRKSRGKALS
jgi:hypothetical protein